MKNMKRDFAADGRMLQLAAIAIAIGVVSTLAACFLLYLIRFFTNVFFYQSLSGHFRSPADNTLGLWVIGVPVVGGLIIGMMARFGSEKIRGHGIPEAIETILFGKSKMSAKVAILKPLSSGIAIGSGGPFGAEGPIIMTGGALGSLLAQHFHLSAAERKALLVAGATAGMTAIFGTPLAAVLLAVELLLFELRPRSLLPTIVACAVAGFLRPLLFDDGALFPLETHPAGPLALLSCAGAGVLAGVLSWALSSSLYKVEDWFAKLPLHWMWWPALGGIAVGIGGYLEPRALGVGYDVIGDLLHNHLPLRFLAGFLICKALMWVIALGSGTSGGVLAPLLMLGAGLGGLLAPFMPGADPALWPLVFMAATLGGMMRAPIMSTIFALELTRDVHALLPLMAACGVAYGFTVLVMKRSILTEKIARRGFHIYREYSIDPLERHTVQEVMTATVQTVDADAAIEEVLIHRFGAQQAHRFFPVVRGERVIGMVDRHMLTNAHGNAACKTLGELFGEVLPVVVYPDDVCRTVASRMAMHALECLPVVADAESGRLVGIVSRSDLIKPSHAIFEEEHQRESDGPLFRAIPQRMAEKKQG